MSDFNHSCKIGTVPFVIFAIDKRSKIKVDNIIRIKQYRGSRWQTIKLTRVDDDGYFMADWH